MMFSANRIFKKTFLIGYKSLLIEIASIGIQILKIQYFLIFMVYWMFGFSLLKHWKTATEKVDFFLSLTVYK